MFSQASKGLRCKALENAVRLLYHKSKQTTFAGARQCPALPQQGLLMVQCSPCRKASLSGNRAAARFGAYHRADHGGNYTTNCLGRTEKQRDRTIRSRCLFASELI